jgi:hypothetical protein
VKSRYSRDTGVVKAFKQLARELTGLLKVCGGELWGVLEMARAVYVDISPTGTNGKWRRKHHVVLDGEKTFGVSRLTELKNVDEIFH